MTLRAAGLRGTYISFRWTIKLLADSGSLPNPCTSRCSRRTTCFGDEDKRPTVSCRRVVVSADTRTSWHSHHDRRTTAQPSEIVCTIHRDMPKPRETCTQCSLRRQRCNRQIPCDRCIKRGVPDQCTRQWPDNQTPTRDLSAARRETSLLIEQHEDVPLRATERLQNQVDHRLVLPDDDRSSALDIISTGNGAERFFDGLNVDAHTFEPRGQSVSAPEAPSFATSIDTQREQVVLRPTVPQAPSEKQTAELELQLPSIEQIWHLVDYHETSLLWYHGCYHGPTFRHELEEALEKGNGILDIENLNLQWMALLFSVMAGSLACCPDRILSTWGFWKTEVFELSLQWYKATVTCLNLSGYMSNHQLLSVHAITTLSMAAHTLGLSEDLSVLLSTALRIARSLRIDHIKYDPALDDIDAQATELRRRKVLRREIARRLWSQLCVQDWFAIPFHGSQCISAIDFTTSKPSNRNHITMEPLPRTFPTYISYGNYLYDIASLVAEHHVAMAHSSTPFTKYQRVLEFDARMKRLARDEMPVYFQVTAPIDASWPEFVPWARRSLTVCFAHKMLMIHRAFIRRSFTNPAFQITKATCIAAARTILNEAKKEREDSAPIIWIDQVMNLPQKSTT